MGVADAFQVAIAEHIDRVRRATAPCRAGIVTRELPGGWMSALPGKPAGDFPSASMHRVYWLRQRDRLRKEQVLAAAEAMRGIESPKAYFWLAPWAWDEGVETMLRANGASLWPYVEYIAFSRRAERAGSTRETEFLTRRVDADEAEDFFGSIAPWYGEDGARTATKMVREGVEEAIGAFIGGKPVGVGLLAMDPEGPGWGYLGAAGTDPAFRGRGVQSSLIAARIARVAQVGANWCTVETNTTVPISLRNLERAGFEKRILWRVYKWEDR